MKIDVASAEERQEALARIAQLERELSFIKSLLIGERLLTRYQAMKALKVSESTLHRLTRSGQLSHTYMGVSPKYCVDSIRNYLQSRLIEAQDVDLRVLAASQS